MLKRYLLSLFTFFIFLENFAQITFDNGYFIDNNGNKKVCLIKNSDWLNNPDKFDYKTSENAEVETIDIQNVKEFSVNNIKYIRSLSKIDVSNQDTDLLNSNRNPEFIEKQVFLKVLVEGPANLYQYVFNNKTLFFVNLNHEPIEPLIFKEYLGEDAEIKSNTAYLQYLLNVLECENITKDDIKNLNYQVKDLMKIIKKYNYCKSGVDVKEEKSNKKSEFNFAFKTGINYSKFSVNNSTDAYLNCEFNDKSNIYIGLEVEYILPVNKNKWSIFITPNYQKYTNKKDGVYIFNVDYNIIKFPTGIRYNLYLKEDSRIFADFAINPVFSMNSNLEYHYEFNNSNTNIVDIRSSVNFAAGFGYKYKRMKIALNYESPSELFKNYFNWSSNFQNFSCTVAFDFLQIK